MISYLNTDINHILGVLGRFTPYIFLLFCNRCKHIRLNAAAVCADWRKYKNNVEKACYLPVDRI